MKNKESLILIIACAVLAIAAWQNFSMPALNETVSEEVFFCPEEGCALQLILKINASEKSIDIAIYSFTHDKIADALIEAKQRGVNIRILMEAQQAGSEYSDDERLSEAGIETKFMGNPLGIMHNKFMIIDSEIVSTGSFNYSENADLRNNENLVFLHNPAIIKRFESEFQRLWNSG